VHPDPRASLGLCGEKHENTTIPRDDYTCHNTCSQHFAARRRNTKLGAKLHSTISDLTSSEAPADQSALSSGILKHGRAHYNSIVTMTLAKELPHVPEWSWLRFRCQFPIVRLPRGVALAIVDGPANRHPIQCQPDRSHTTTHNTHAIVAIVLLTAGWLAHPKILNLLRQLIHH
jgi:hypothetical protein